MGKFFESLLTPAAGILGGILAVTAALAVVFGVVSLLSRLVS
jgi:hypothetical protein